MAGRSSMSYRSNPWALALVALFAITGTPWPRCTAAEAPPGHPRACPRLLFVTPAGGQAGSEFEMVVTGEHLDEPDALRFSHAGVTAQWLGTLPTPDAAYKRTNLRRWTRLVAQRYLVRVDSSVTPGIHDVRLSNRWGVSNPRAFAVGDLKEGLESEPNNDVETAQTVKLNQTIQGTISSPVDIDYFRFTGNRSQRVVVACLASSIDSRLPAAVELYDSAGKLLATNHGYDGTDAVADAILTADDEYLVRVSSYGYIAGSPEHFYRVSISTAPWIDMIVPSVVEPGKESKVSVFGRNLPGAGAPNQGVGLERLEVTVVPPAEPMAQVSLTFSGYVAPRSVGLDGFELRLRNSTGVSNPYLLRFADGPVVIDNRRNGLAESAQTVPLPCEIVGVFDEKQNRDWYSFVPQKGTAYTIEAFGDRLGLPVDLQLAIRNPKTAQVLRPADDEPNVLSRFQLPNWTTDPPAYRFQSTTGELQQLSVMSHDSSAAVDLRHGYHVRIAAEQPDFRLIVMGPCDQVPNSTAFDLLDVPVLRAGGAQYLWVYAIRRGGFTDVIDLSVEGLPDGVVCSPQTLGASMSQGALVLQAAADAKSWDGPIRVRGSAEVNGQSLVRQARSAGLVWSAAEPNYSMISRLNRETVLAVRDQRLLPYRISGATERVQATPGSQVTIALRLERLWSDLKAPVSVTALNLPATVTLGLANQPITFSPGKDTIDAVLHVKENATGKYSICFQGIAVVNYTGDKSSSERAENIPLLQPSPPILLEVSK